MRGTPIRSHIRPPSAASGAGTGAATASATAIASASSTITHGLDIKGGAPVGLLVSTTRTLGGDRATDTAWFSDNSFPGSGTVGSPYLIDRVHFTSKLTLGAGAGSSALIGKYVKITNCRFDGDPGNPTPDNSRCLFVDTDGPLVTIEDSTLGPAGGVSGSGGPAAGVGVDKVILSYQSIQVTRCDLYGGNVAIGIEVETTEAASVFDSCWLHDTWSAGSDHTDLGNGNFHASHVTLIRCFLDGIRTGGTYVVNGIGIYNDLAGNEGGATITDWTIQDCYLDRCQTMILSTTDTAKFTNPYVVTGNVFDRFSVTRSSMRVPSTQSGNVDGSGTPITFS